MLTVKCCNKAFIKYNIKKHVINSYKYCLK